MKFRRRSRVSAPSAWVQQQGERRQTLSDLDRHIIVTLETMRTDLQTIGKVPSRIYALVGDAGDPHAQLLGQMPIDPTVDIPAAYDKGFRLPAEAHGVAIVTPGFRHLRYEEAVERNPMLISRMRASMEMENAVPDERLKLEFEKRYYTQVLPGLPAAGSLPPFMRVEVSAAAAVLRDGRNYFIHGDVDGDNPVAQIFDGSNLAGLQVSKVMYMLLHGVRPDVKCEDPRQVVSDFKTVQALADLPTTGEPS